MATEQLNLKLTAQDQASAKIKKLEKTIKGAGKQAKSSSLSFGAMTGAIALGSIAANVATKAFTAITDFIGGSITAAAESEKVWNLVTASLERNGLATEENIASIKAFADELQTLTGVSDEEYGGAVRRMIDAGQDLSTSFDLVTAAADIAASTGKGTAKILNQISDAIIKEDVVALEKWTGAIDTSLPFAEQLDIALKRIDDRFGGAAAENADTYSTRIAVLGQKIGDLQEKIGEFLMPTLLLITDAFIAAVDGINQFIVAAKLLATPLDAMILGFKVLFGIVDLTPKKFDTANKSANIFSSGLDKLNTALRDGTITLEEYKDQLALLTESLDDVPDKQISPLQQVDLDLMEGMNKLFDSLLVELKAGEISFDEFKELAVQAAADVGRATKTDIIDPYTSLTSVLSDGRDAVQLYADQALDMAKAFDTVKESLDGVSTSIGKIVETGGISPVKAEDLINFDEINDTLADQDKVRFILADEAGKLRIGQEKEMNDLLNILTADALGEKEFTVKERQAAILALEEEQGQARLELKESQNQVERDITQAHWDAIQGIVSSVQLSLDAVGIKMSTKAFDRLVQFKGGIDQISKSVKALDGFFKGFSKALDGVSKSTWTAIKASVVYVAQLIAEGVAALASVGAHIAEAAVKAAKAVAGIPFIGPALAIAAAAAIVGGLAFLLKGFDDPANDAVAFRFGKDAGDNFMLGFQSVTGSPGFGSSVMGSLAGGGNLPSTGGGSITLSQTIIIEGGAGDQEFVENVLAPQIEQASFDGMTRIMTAPQRVTGGSTESFGSIRSRTITGIVSQPKDQ